MTNLIKITEIEQEPRIQDIVLGRALGLKRSRAIRQVIESNMPELLTYGRAPLQMADVKIGCAARKIESYYLNEPQALLICMFSRTDRAAQVRKEVIEAYMSFKAQNKAEVIEVSPYTRRLPSGAREIKLSEKARSEIGGIVKACCGVAIREELKAFFEIEHVKVQVPVEPTFKEKIWDILSKCESTLPPEKALKTFSTPVLLEEIGRRTQTQKA